MSKDSEIGPQETKHTMSSSEGRSKKYLYSKLKDVVNASSDKEFIKSKLIKPLIVCQKHSFMDDCGPVAVFEFKLIKAAYEYYCDMTQGDSSVDEQAFSKTGNQWKDSCFISNEESHSEPYKELEEDAARPREELDITGASEGSDLEKVLSDLQMTEISNNISDPEVLDFCKMEFSRKSFSGALYSNATHESSPPVAKLTPMQDAPIEVAFELDIRTECASTQSECDSGDLPLNSKLPPVGEKVNCSRGVKRKRKTLLGMRKKRKKKSSLSRSKNRKSILVRNSISTDSSDQQFKLEENICVSNGIKHNSLDGQEFIRTDSSSVLNKIERHKSSLSKHKPELADGMHAEKTSRYKMRRCKQNNLSKTDSHESFIVGNVNKVDAKECLAISDAQESELAGAEVDSSTYEMTKEDNSYVQDKFSNFNPTSSINETKDEVHKISSNIDEVSENEIFSKDLHLNCLKSPESSSAKSDCEISSISKKYDRKNEKKTKIKHAEDKLSNFNSTSAIDETIHELLKSCTNVDEVSENGEFSKDSHLNCRKSPESSSANSDCEISQVSKKSGRKNEKKTKINPKKILKVKISKPKQTSGKDRGSPQKELFKRPKAISSFENPRISMQITVVEGTGNNVRMVSKSPKTLSEVPNCTTLFPTSEPDNRQTSQTIDKTPETVSPQHSKIAGSSPKKAILPRSATTDKTPKTALLPHSEIDKSPKTVPSHSAIKGILEEILKSPKSQVKKNPVIKPTESPSVIESNTVCKKETDFSNALVNTSIQKTPEKCFIENHRHDDEISMYDYEPDSDLSEHEFSNKLGGNEDRDSSSGDEDWRSRKWANRSAAVDTYVAQVTPPEVSSSQAVLEETAVSSVDGVSDVSKNEDPSLSNPCEGKGVGKRHAVFSDDEDSNSDSEHSFKRRMISPPEYQNQNGIKEQVSSLSSTKVDVVPEQHINKLTNVVHHLKFHCSNHNITVAISIANRYLKISNQSVCIEIFEVLFLGIHYSVCTTNKINEDTINEAFDMLKAFAEDPETPVTGLCSMIIPKYLEHSLLTKFGLDLCGFCQTKGIAINSRAVNAYADTAVHINIPTCRLLSFLEYVKNDCKLSFPKALLQQVTERVSRGKDCCMFPDFSKLCDLLCMLEGFELEGDPLQKFLEVCIVNDCWDHIAKIFLALSSQKLFCQELLMLLLSRNDKVGMLFKKLANSVYGTMKEIDQETRMYSVFFFGLTGIVLMLNSFYKGLKDEENPKNIFICNANQLLCTLLKYSIDIFDVANSCNSDTTQNYLYSHTESFDLILLPFHVIFAAIEICLLLEKPKNAYEFFKSYPKVLQDLPDVSNESLKSRLSLKYFELFLKTTKMLYYSDSLEAGLNAFRELITILHNEVFLSVLKKCEDLKVVETIFNDFLVTYMNKSLYSTVFELYQYNSGHCESIVTFTPQVLRGLVVTFAKSNKTDEAWSVFVLGCHKKIYQFEKPVVNECPRKLTLSSIWTSYEMKFIIERFLKSLFPFFKEKKAKLPFEDWFSVKILFKEQPNVPSKINCLIEPPAPNTLGRACVALKAIDQDFTWTEHEGCILLGPQKVYDYYRKNCGLLKENTFAINSPIVYSFGLTGKGTDPHETSPHAKSTPTKCHLPGEVSSTTSDHGHSLPNNLEYMAAKRRISFSSSDRSPSRTPETSAGRELRLNIERPFQVCPSSSNSQQLPKSPNSELRRSTDSDMSQLSNFVCTMIPSPNQNSPQKTYQDMPSPFKQPDRIFHSPQRQGCGSDSLQRSNWVHSSRAEAFQAPPQDNRNAPVLRSTSIPGEMFQFPAKQNSRDGSLEGSNSMQDRFQSSEQQGNSMSNSHCGTFKSPRQEGSKNSPVKRFNSMNNSSASNSEFVNRHQGAEFGSGLLKDPPRSQRIVDPWVTSEETVPLNEYSPTANPKNPDSGSSQLLEPSESQPEAKQRILLKRNCKKVGAGAIKIVRKANLTVTQSTNRSVNTFVPIRQNDPNAASSLNEQIHSSLTNHSPDLSVFTAPPKSKPSVKRRLPTNKDPEPPRLPPYRIPTPCKQLKVIRPATPGLKPSSLRCKSLLPFQSGYQHVKPVKRQQERGVLHRATGNQSKSTINFKSFQDFKVSVLGDTSNRRIVAPQIIAPSPKINRINCLTEVGESSAIPVRTHANIREASVNSNVPEDVFQKVLTFIKSQVFIKWKELDEKEKISRAKSLTNTFIKTNAVQKLDTKTRKVLCEFTKNCIT